MLRTYRNQSIGLLSKSTDWFLYEGNTGTQWVNIEAKFEGDLLDRLPSKWF